MQNEIEKYLDESLDDIREDLDAITSTYELALRAVLSKLDNRFSLILENFIKGIMNEYPSYTFKHFYGEYEDVLYYIDDEKALRIRRYSEFHYHSLESEWRVKTDPVLMSLIEKISEFLNNLGYERDKIADTYEDFLKQW